MTDKGRFDEGSPEDILFKAMGRFDRLLLVGVTKDGGFAIHMCRETAEDAFNALGMMDHAKHILHDMILNEAE